MQVQNDVCSFYFLIIIFRGIYLLFKDRNLATVAEFIYFVNALCFHYVSRDKDPIY